MMVHRKPHRCVLAGYTGAVGGALLRYLLKSPFCDSVVAVGRAAPKTLPQSLINAPGLTVRMVGFPEVSVHDLMSLPEGPKDEFVNHSAQANVAFCALGVRDPGNCTVEEMESIDLKSTVNFANACREAGVTHMNLLSCIRADPASWVNYSRIKGEAVQAIDSMGFERFSVYKPGYIMTEEPRGGIGGAITRFSHPFVSQLLATKYRDILDKDVARAMLLNVDTCSAEGTEHLLFEDMMQILGKGPP